MIKTLLFAAVLTANAADEQVVISAIADSSRSTMFAENAQDRTVPKPSIAPGLAPVLSFRYFQDSVHHRFGNVDLMLDDAGH